MINGDLAAAAVVEPPSDLIEEVAEKQGLRDTLTAYFTPKSATRTRVPTSAFSHDPHDSMVVAGRKATTTTGGMANGATQPAARRHSDASVSSTAAFRQRNNRPTPEHNNNSSSGKHGTNHHHHQLPHHRRDRDRDRQRSRLTGSSPHKRPSNAGSGARAPKSGTNGASPARVAANASLNKSIANRHNRNKSSSNNGSPAKTQQPETPTRSSNSTSSCAGELPRHLAELQDSLSANFITNDLCRRRPPQGAYASAVRGIVGGASASPEPRAHSAASQHNATDTAKPPPQHPSGSPQPPAATTETLSADEMSDNLFERLATDPIIKNADPMHLKSPPPKSLSSSSMAIDNNHRTHKSNASTSRTSSPAKQSSATNSTTKLSSTTATTDGGGSSRRKRALLKNALRRGGRATPKRTGNAEGDAAEDVKTEDIIDLADDDALMSTPSTSKADVSSLSKSQKKRRRQPSSSQATTTTPAPSTVETPAASTSKRARPSQLGVKKDEPAVCSQVASTSAAVAEKPPPRRKPVTLKNLSDPPELTADDQALFDRALKNAGESITTHQQSPSSSQSDASARHPPSVQLGRHLMDTWYSAPYPIEYARLSRLFICEFCLKYLKSRESVDRHRAKCTMRHPPGDELYRDPARRLAVFQVDGDESRIYCQNLCLLAKMFLDHKTLYYDVEPFLFYVLTTYDQHGCHLVGYFSKEKYNSTHRYNLSCIVTLPSYQRCGYGRFLIDFSFALSRVEGVPGAPEQPLSDLGRITYMRYWKSAILEHLYNVLCSGGGGSSKQKAAQLSIMRISKATGIAAQDVCTTLQRLAFIRYDKSRSKRIYLRINRTLVESHYKKARLDKQRIWLNPTLLKYTPVEFSPRSEAVRSPVGSPLRRSGTGLVSPIAQSPTTSAAAMDSPVRNLFGVSPKKPMVELQLPTVVAATSPIKKAGRVLSTNARAVAQRARRQRDRQQLARKNASAAQQRRQRPPPPRKTAGGRAAAAAPVSQRQTRRSATVIAAASSEDSSAADSEDDDDAIEIDLDSDGGSSKTSPIVTTVSSDSSSSDSEKEDEDAVVDESPSRTKNRHRRHRSSDEDSDADDHKSNRRERRSPSKPKSSSKSKSSSARGTSTVARQQRKSTASNSNSRRAAAVSKKQMPTTADTNGEAQSSPVKQPPAAPIKKLPSAVAEQTTIEQSTIEQQQAKAPASPLPAAAAAAPEPLAAAKPDLPEKLTIETSSVDKPIEPPPFDDANNDDEDDDAVSSHDEDEDDAAPPVLAPAAAECSPAGDQAPTLPLVAQHNDNTNGSKDNTSPPPLSPMFAATVEEVDEPHSPVEIEPPAPKPPSAGNRAEKQRSSTVRASLLGSSSSSTKSRSLDSHLRLGDDDKNPLVNVGGEASDSDEQTAPSLLAHTRGADDLNFAPKAPRPINDESFGSASATGRSRLSTALVPLNPPHNQPAVLQQQPPMLYDVMPPTVAATAPPEPSVVVPTAKQQPQPPPPPPPCVVEQQQQQQPMQQQPMPTPPSAGHPCQQALQQQTSPPVVAPPARRVSTDLSSPSSYSAQQQHQSPHNQQAAQSCQVLAAQQQAAASQQQQQYCNGTMSSPSNQGSIQPVTPKSQQTQFSSPPPPPQQPAQQQQQPQQQQQQQPVSQPLPAAAPMPPTAVTVAQQQQQHTASVQPQQQQSRRQHSNSSSKSNSNSSSGTPNAKRSHHSSSKVAHSKAQQSSTSNNNNTTANNNNNVQQQISNNLMYNYPGQPTVIPGYDSNMLWSYAWKGASFPSYADMYSQAASFYGSQPAAGFQSGIIPSSMSTMVAGQAAATANNNAANNATGNSSCSVGGVAQQSYGGRPTNSAQPVHNGAMQGGGWASTFAAGNAPQPAAFVDPAIMANSFSAAANQHQMQAAMNQGGWGMAQPQSGWGTYGVPYPHPDMYSMLPATAAHGGGGVTGKSAGQLN